MRNLTLRQLRILTAVTKSGSMAGAARELNVTPPAITVQMQQLEQTAGLPLVERLGDGTIPTSAGEVLIMTAQRIEAVLVECEQEIARLKGIKGGHVSVGVVSTAKYFAPKALAAFKQRHPGVELRLSVYNRRETIAALQDLTHDLAIMGRPPDNLESAVLGDHPHIIVAASGHPLAGSAIAVGDLANETFFIREQGSGTRMLMETFFEDAAFAPTIGMEIGSNETIKQAVIAGLGVAFISAHTVAVELSDRRLTVLQVAGLPIVRKWFVVRIREKAMMPACEAMWEFLTSEAHKHLPEPAIWASPKI
jgi:LysR family transcriptional regulator, low CO2-responsive transcriptional regulator